MVDPCLYLYLMWPLLSFLLAKGLEPLDKQSLVIAEDVVMAATNRKV